MSSEKLMPVVIYTYTRLNHLKATLNALRENTLAAKSTVLIFSDGPRPGDETKVQEVRDFLHSFRGFNKMEIVERSENNLKFNIYDGLHSTLDKYDRAIIMEDDIVTAPGYLSFMNEAMNKYQDDPRILSICGYSLPLPWISNDDIFVLSRYCAWGLAITKEKLNLIKTVSKEDFNAIVPSRMDIYGQDIYRMMRKEATGELDALDVRAMFLQYKTGLFTVYPRKSLVQNIGNDGSGIHCDLTDKFNHNELWNKTENFKFSDDLTLHSKNIEMNYKFRSGSWWKRFRVRYLKRNRYKPL